MAVPDSIVNRGNNETGRPTGLLEQMFHVEHCARNLEPHPFFDINLHLYIVLYIIAPKHERSRNGQIYLESQAERGFRTGPPTAHRPWTCCPSCRRDAGTVSVTCGLARALDLPDRARPFQQPILPAPFALGPDLERVPGGHLRRRQTATGLSCQPRRGRHLAVTGAQKLPVLARHVSRLWHSGLRRGRSAVCFRSRKGAPGPGAGRARAESAGRRGACPWHLRDFRHRAEPRRGRFRVRGRR